MDSGNKDIYHNPISDTEKPLSVVSKPLSQKSVDAKKSSTAVGDPVTSNKTTGSTTALA
jgi:hypothetical protein